MSREIKFRVWGIAYDQYLTSHDGVRFYFGDDYESLDIFLVWNRMDYRFVIEQFIGRQDCEGRDVYEGDIVEFSVHGATHGRYREDGIRGEVWYCNEDAMFCFGKYIYPEYKDEKTGYIRSAYRWWYSAADDIDWKTFKVVGNVHEVKQ